MIKYFSFIILGLVLSSDITFAQILCGSQPVYMDSKEHSCPMQNKHGKCNKVMFVITGFNASTDFGAHISSANRLSKNIPITDCAIQTKKGFCLLRCREIHGGKQGLAEKYEVFLGRKRDIDFVKIEISRRLIKVTVDKHSTSLTKNKSNGSKQEKIPYILEAIIPTKEGTGFCSKPFIYYKPNGALYKYKKDGDFKGGKDGSGYRITAYLAPF